MQNESRLNDAVHPSSIMMHENPKDEIDHQLIPLLISISKSTRTILQLRLSEIGFYNGQDDLLISLSNIESSTVTDLARKVCVRASTMSKMVDTLLERGLVERRPDPADARRVYVRLTPKGVVARDRILLLRYEIEAELSRALGGREALRMRAELSAVNQQLQKRLSRVR